MKNELCFFLQTPKDITGTQLLLLQLSSHIAETTDISTYFVNSTVSKYAQQVSAKLHLYEVGGFDFSAHRDAVYITTTNYLFYLLSHIGENKKAKVFCISNFAGCYESLLSQIANFQGNKGALMELLSRENACTFVNRDSYEEVKDYLGNREPNVYLSEVGGFEELKVYQPVGDADSQRIRVGWHGAISGSTRYPIQNLLDHLLALPGEQKIDVHIVGDGNLKWSIDYSPYAPRMRFFFAPLTDKKEQQIQYLQENTDVVFSYGSAALHAAAGGLPTVLVPLCNVPYQDDGYLFFHELPQGVLSWKAQEPGVLQDKLRTVHEIMERVRHEKAVLGEHCYRYGQEHHSLHKNGQALLDMVQQCSLTVEKCLETVVIREHMTAFYQRLNKGKVADYAAYHSKINKKTVKGMKSAIRSGLSESYKDMKAYIKANCPLILELKRRISYFAFWKLQRQYKKKLKRISLQAGADGKIKVAFILVFNSVFPTRPVFEAMLKNPRFDPYIVVAPNVSRGHRYQMQVYTEAVTALTEQYPGRVIEGYCEKYDQYYEMKDEFKLIFFCNPYPKLVHRFHGLEYFLDKDVLTVYANYGFAALSFWNEVLTSEFYNKVWLACIETETNLSHLKKHQQISGYNGKVTGYLKMDKMASITPAKRERKRIIISPHHTVWGWSTLNIGNFLSYCDLFKELPKRYPQIDFVFRPHPLLFSNLLAHKIWSQEKIDAYLAELEANENAVYDYSGDYFEQFVNSDAMIHDCGSFIGEYLYTEKPCCYMLKSVEQTKEGLVPLGQKCMENYYHAFKEEDIISFIEDVVLRGNDPMKERREQFVRTELKFNYPHATEDLVQMLERMIFIETNKE